MKRRILCFLMLMTLTAQAAMAAVGHPFFVNYTPSEYGGHNRNFDVLTDRLGRVYVANFEGVMCYDQSRWHMVHAPGIFRITRLFEDSKGRIWVGGYNVFGYLTSTANGELALTTIFSRSNKGFIGEVTEINEENGKIGIVTSIGTAGIEDNSMKDYKIEKQQAEDAEYFAGYKINAKKRLQDGTTVIATAGGGIIVVDKERRELYRLSEREGLCNNNVNAVSVDDYGNVWGATDDGVFVTDIYTAYTCFKATDGLPGEVLSICQTSNGLYVGTLRGLFVKRGNAFRQVGDITNSCWSLCLDGNGDLCASTAGGLYIIKGENVRQLTKSHTISTMPVGDGTYYVGEIDGVRLVNASGSVNRKVNTVEKATCFISAEDGSLWMRNIYGQVFRCTGDYSKLNPVTPPSTNQDDRYNNTIFVKDGDIYMMGNAGMFKWDKAKGTLVEDNKDGNMLRSNKYPLMVYSAPDGKIWLSDNQGKNLKVFTDHADGNALNEMLRPVADLSVRSFAIDGDHAWMGGSFGLICWNSAYKDLDLKHRSKMFIRQVVMDNDSIIWGGFTSGDKLEAKLPFSNLSFGSDVRSITIRFSTDMLSTLGNAEYRYRLHDDDRWSEWSGENFVTLANPRSGNYTFEVMARDRYGREIQSAKLHITVQYPIYLRWYFLVVYVLVLALLVVAFVRWRMARLLKEKMRLENIVEERTSQIRKQKDEIEEKSNSLEKALEDLGAAQYQLLRQERMATVGKLTKGLVDRILNPMNYVNNFSHMSLGLLKDIRENLEDDEEKMTPDNYDDCLDIVEMLNTNLTKIEEHGINTTRILKAMEEMLKERKCNIRETDIASLCRLDIEMTHSYFAKEIAECNIAVEAIGIDKAVMAEVDNDQISRVIMSMIGNSIYALRKKYAQKAYDAVLRLKLNIDNAADNLLISIYDNGIGIEEAIVDKIFDPFFTTKTTAEAVGVGMYLSREIVLNHGGEILVDSVKEVETRFTIVLPLKQKDRNHQNI
ncbi:MAG: ATP-binding protein [Prevotella sp.]